MEKESAIYQMFTANRGNISAITMSDKYLKLLSDFVEQDKTIRAALEKYPALLEQYAKISDLSDNANMQSTYEFFAEGFRFGIQLGMDIVCH